MKELKENKFIVGGLFLLISFCINLFIIFFYSDDGSRSIAIGGLFSIPLSILLVCFYFKDNLSHLLTTRNISELKKPLSILIYFISWVSLTSSALILLYPLAIKAYQQNPAFIISPLVSGIILFISLKITNFDIKELFSEINKQNTSDSTVKAFNTGTLPTPKENVSSFRLRLPKSDNGQFTQAYSIALFCYIRDKSDDNLFKSVKDSDNLLELNFIDGLLATNSSESKFKIYMHIIPFCVHRFSFKQDVQPHMVMDSNKFKSQLCEHFKDTSSLTEDLGLDQLDRLSIKWAPNIQVMLADYSNQISFILSQIKHEKAISLARIRELPSIEGKGKKVCSVVNLANQQTKNTQANALH